MFEISKSILNHLRKEYPHGTRVKLVRMDDFQAPSVGTLGTVVEVDDMGNLQMNWDNGSCLAVIYGVDGVEKVTG